MSDSARPPASGARVQGRSGALVKGVWRIDARIGSGGMATVYAVTHRDGRRGALKMLHPQLSHEPEVRNRFLREGPVANAVGHPGVVRVLDSGVTEEKTAYLVMELLEGETMEAKRTRLGGRIPVDEALDAAEQALDVLAAAHARDIVHRDLKPDNLFLTTANGVKVLDFGLARMKDAASEATKTGMTIGTPEFMSPEQAAGKASDVGIRSDVWAIGATLFTAITGEYVHDASTLREQLVAHATQRARPIRKVAPYVPKLVADVIDRALDLDPSARFANAGEMRAGLRDARGLFAPKPSPESVTIQVPSSQRSEGLGKDSVEETTRSMRASSPPQAPSQAPPPPTSSAAFFSANTTKLGARVNPFADGQVTQKLSPARAAQSAPPPPPSSQSLAKATQSGAQPVGSPSSRTALLVTILVGLVALVIVGMVLAMREHP